MIALSTPARAVDAAEFPHFRHVDRALTKPEAVLPVKITLLADGDFAPFSFRSIEGKSAGISLQLALAACGQLKVTCEVKFYNFADLVPALRAKQGDVIVGGPSSQIIETQGLTATRPYYFSFGQFVARAGLPFQGVDGKALAGRRLGVVKSSAQDQFLKLNFTRSSLIVFDNAAALFEGLRTGTIDLAFADSTQVAFWLKGEDARGCCASYGKAFAERETITKGLAMMMRREDKNLAAAFDYALDQLQENGTTAKVFETYLPSTPF